MMTSKRVTRIGIRVDQRRSRNSDEKGQLQVDEAAESSEWLVVGNVGELGEPNFFWSKLPHPLQASLLRCTRTRFWEHEQGNEVRCTSHYHTLSPRCPEDDRDLALSSLYEAYSTALDKRSSPASQGWA